MQLPFEFLHCAKRLQSRFMSTQWRYRYSWLPFVNSQQRVSFFLQFKIWALVLTRRVKHELSRVTLTFSFFSIFDTSHDLTLQMVEKPWISIDYKTVDVLFRRVNKCSSEYRVLLVRRVSIFLINYGSLYKLENFEKKVVFARTLKC